MQNDQAAILTSTIAPPPADLVLRVAMFGSWGIPAAQGLAGATMNTVTFYVIRFSVPVVAIPLVLSAEVPHRAIYAWSAVLGATIAVGLLGLLWAVLRRERAAVWIGTTAGRLVARVRCAVDPEAWATSAVDFRSHVVRRSRRWSTPAVSRPIPISSPGWWSTGVTTLLVPMLFGLASIAWWRRGARGL